MTTPSIPSSSITLFNATTAPTGWTQVTTYNDAMLRVTSNSSVSTGGSIGFTSGLVNNITATATVSFPSITLSPSTGDIAPHTHGGGAQITFSGRYGPGTSPAITVFYAGGSYTLTGSETATNTGSGTAHSHTASQPSSYPTFSVTGETLNFAIQYVDLLIAQRN